MLETRDRWSVGGGAYCGTTTKLLQINYDLHKKFKNNYSRKGCITYMCNADFSWHYDLPRNFLIFFTFQFWGNHHHRGVCFGALGVEEGRAGQGVEGMEWGMVDDDGNISSAPPPPRPHPLIWPPEYCLWHSELEQSCTHKLLEMNNTYLISWCFST